MQQLVGKDLKDHYAKMRKFEAELAESILRSFSMHRTTGYLIGYWNSLLLNERLQYKLDRNLNFAVAHLIECSAAVCNMESDTFDPVRFESVIEQHAVFIKRGIYENFLDHAKGILIDGFTKIEFDLEKIPNLSEYLSYCQRLDIMHSAKGFEENNYYSVAKNLQVFDPLLERAYGASAEEIIKFCRRLCKRIDYKLAHAQRFDAEFEKNNFRWNHHAFCFNWSEISQISEGFSGAERFISDLILDNKSTRVQRSVNSQVYTFPFIRIGPWIYVVINVFAGYIEDIIKHLIQRKFEKKEEFSEIFKKLLEKYTTNKVAKLLSTGYGYSEVCRNYEPFPGEQYEFDLVMSNDAGETLLIEVKSRNPPINLINDYSPYHFHQHLNSEKKKSIHQLQRFQSRLNDPISYAHLLSLLDSQSIRLLSITEFPSLATHFCDVFCCSIREAELLVDLRLEMNRENLLNLTKKMGSDLYEALNKIEYSHSEFQVFSSEEDCVNQPLGYAIIAKEFDVTGALVEPGKRMLTYSKFPGDRLTILMTDTERVAKLVCQQKGANLKPALMTVKDLTNSSTYLLPRVRDIGRLVSIGEAKYRIGEVIDLETLLSTYNSNI